MRSVQKTKHQCQIKSVRMLFCEIQEIVWYLSLMKLSYNLTKGTKIEKNESI